MSVVVPARNAEATLAGCLASIARASGDLCVEVLVADNGSVDGTAAVAAAAGARVVSLPGMRVSALRSRAAADTSGRILAFIDADHEIGADWFRLAIQRLDETGVGAAGAAYLAPSPGTWVQRLYDLLRRRPEGVHDAAWLPSGNLAVTRRVFEEVNGFDPRLESCEDVDFCRRVRARGYRLVSDSRLESVHHGDPATLRDLFRGELWRGRDTLMGLRPPVQVRDLPSTLYPVLTLGLIAAGLLLVPLGVLIGWWPLGAVGIMLAAIPLPRMAIIVRRGRLRPPRDWARAYALSAVYELARALALVMRAGHEVRRGEG
ncbi:MAG TPA: glycosyltransferase [Methylomirabilota bacterium]